MIRTSLMSDVSFAAFLQTHPVSGGKGDSTLKAQEQAQANFTKTLMKAYKTQFAQQSQILSFLTNKLTPLINNPQGFSPETLASMRTQATEGTARSFQQGQQALNEAEAARGGSVLPSGVDAQLRAEGTNAAAAQNTASQQAITLADEQQKEQNYWNAVNALSGNAAQYNPIGYAGQATSGSGAVADLGSAYKSSQSSQLLGALGGLAGGVGSALGGYFGSKH